MKYYLLRGGESSFVSGTLLIVQVIALPLFVWLSRRLGKTAAFRIGALIWVVMMLISFLIQPGNPVFFIYLFAGIVGVGTGGVVVMMYAIFPDIPDVDELNSNERREGIFSALVTFMRKLSSAVAIFLVSQVIGLAGYVAPIKEVVNGATKLIEQPQPATFILALRLIFALAPVILVGGSLLFAARYPLTPQKHARLNRVLAEIRSGSPLSPELSREREALRRELVK